MRRLVALFSLISGLAILFLTGCKAKPPESHYPIQEEVIVMDLPRKLLIVQHGVLRAHRGVIEPRGNRVRHGDLPV